MGEAEWFENELKIRVYSDFYFYGNAASASLAAQIASDIADHWNQPQGLVMLRNRAHQVEFVVRGFCENPMSPEYVWFNTDPRNNYFRIEEISPQHVSFVDGIGCNTGFFKLDNLRDHSTTAAHEYGHTLGLVHPDILDIRGQGQPGIMYPRGTVCDPAFQYDPAAEPLQAGGTLNPYSRKVLQSDIDGLRLHKLTWNKNRFAVLGDFSSLYHGLEQIPS
jgi:hypothetical protein